MMERTIHDFGVVDEKSDAFEFTEDPFGNEGCRLVAVLQTERGPRRTEVAAVPSSHWNVVSAAAVRELAAEMGDTEREKKAPTFRSGVNRISPLVGRELGVLLIALMEDGAARPRRHAAALLARTRARGALVAVCQGRRTRPKSRMRMASRSVSRLE